MMKHVVTVGSLGVIAAFAIALANADDSYTSSTTTTKSTSAKSCTDENGVTLHRGEKGFRDCLKKEGQMSGTMGSDMGNGSMSNNNNGVLNNGNSVPSNTDTTTNSNTTGSSDSANMGAGSTSGS